MADDVKITNLPTSEAHVGLEFYRLLRQRYAAPSIQDEFALFSACVSAAKGYRYEVPPLTE